MTIVEPSDKHYYQPLWTLVGGGVFPREDSERNEADYIPAGANWVRDFVTSFDPEKNQVSVGDGNQLDYDALVVCPGLELKWDAIQGLSKDVIGRNGICCNYSYDTVNSTWRTLQDFQQGTALFTHPFGAGQMWRSTSQNLFPGRRPFSKTGSS